MYGSDDTDPVVKYYDETVGISGESELNWYLEKVKLFGGPVLDLACGTGRIALLLSERGYEMVGIDDSEGMLNIFRKKLLEKPEDVQKRIIIQREKMSDFHVNRKFGTIICIDAFFHNLTVKEEMDCLLCVAAHLKPEGRFLFNIPNPNLEFLLKGADPKGTAYTERKSYPLKDSTIIRIEESHTVDLMEQTVATNLRYTRIDKTGADVGTEESQWKIRYLFQYEAIHLLCRCGFEVESVVGDYCNGPVTTTSHLIFQARLAHSREVG